MIFLSLRVEFVNQVVDLRRFGRRVGDDMRSVRSAGID